MPLIRETWNTWSLIFSTLTTSQNDCCLAVVFFHFCLPVQDITLDSWNLLWNYPGPCLKNFIYKDWFGRELGGGLPNGITDLTRSQLWSPIVHCRPIVPYRRNAVTSIPFPLRGSGGARMLSLKRHRFEEPTIWRASSIENAAPNYRCVVLLLPVAQWAVWFFYHAGVTVELST